MVNLPSFEFASAGRILFGPGRLAEIGPITANLGKRVLIVTGSEPSRVQPLIACLEEVKIEYSTYSISGEPTTVTIQEGVETARLCKAEIVVAMGGGSAIDAGKAIAAVATNPGDLFDHLEVIGKAQPLQQAPLSFIAIPTTAGTGAEVTKNAVIASPEHQVKVSLRSPLMLPKVAIIDPELMLHMPPKLTASTGMDALTQVLEPFVSHKATPMTDGFCREGLKRAGRSLSVAYSTGINLEARSDMAIAALMGGLALANSGLGVVHGFAGPLGGRFKAPHGAVCASLLAESVRVNLAALEQREPDSPARDRFEEATRLLLGDPKACADDLVPWLSELTSELKIPRLGEFGIQQDHFEEIVDQSRQASSMKGNPIALNDDELTTILQKSL